METELETFELKTFNPNCLIWISTVDTFNFNSNPLSLDITFHTTCKTDTVYYKYRYDAISIGLISDWTKVSCLQSAFRAFKQI